jgi:DoxX-like family
MTLLFDVLSVLVLLAALGSATMDFRGAPQILDLMQRLQYRPGFERTLGLIKTVGALGLFVGLFVHWIGVVAALGFVAYFALAIRAHFKIGDPVKEAAGAFALFILSTLTFVVGILS